MPRALISRREIEDDMLDSDNTRESEQSARETPSCCTSLQHAERADSNSETNDAVAIVPSHESALAGIFEISKALSAPSRLEVTFAKVVHLLRSFVQMRHASSLSSTVMANGTSP
ncbi:hypothetical protein AJ88_43240 [Mesorhizobium amorphae CCBAU 01583]|nr:hypothetical protein AJ88_43240 [Mesorhizobium amorphae CCBAU 01583]